MPYRQKAVVEIERCWGGALRCPLECGRRHLRKPATLDLHLPERGSLVIFALE